MGNSFKKIDKQEKSFNLIFNLWKWRLNKEISFCTMTLTKTKKTDNFHVGECIEYKSI